MCSPVRANMTNIVYDVGGTVTDTSDDTVASKTAVVQESQGSCVGSDFHLGYNLVDYGWQSPQDLWLSCEMPFVATRISELNKKWPQVRMLSKL